MNLRLLLVLQKEKYSLPNSIKWVFYSSFSTLNISFALTFALSYKFLALHDFEKKLYSFARIYLYRKITCIRQDTYDRYLSLEVFCSLRYYIRSVSCALCVHKVINCIGSFLFMSTKSSKSTKNNLSTIK